ncbi:hypothetical protein D3C81_851380 [compost metagenome]
MWQQHGGKRLSFAVARDGKQRLQFHAIAGLETHGAALGHLLGVNTLPRFQHLFQLVAGTTEYIPTTRVPITVHIHQQGLSIAAAVDKADVLLWQQRHQCLVQLRIGPAGVEIDHARASRLRRGRKGNRRRMCPLHPTHTAECIRRQHIGVAPIQRTDDQLCRPVIARHVAVYALIVRGERHRDPLVRQFQRLPLATVL